MNRTFSLDFDETFSADPQLWSDWVKLARSMGHRVVCITARRESFENRRELAEALPEGVEVLFSYGEPKRLRAERAGIRVDVWIDDSPSAIEEPRQ